MDIEKEISFAKTTVMVIDILRDLNKSHRANSEDYDEDEVMEDVLGVVHAIEDRPEAIRNRYGELFVIPEDAYREYARECLIGKYATDDYKIRLICEKAASAATESDRKAMRELLRIYNLLDGDDGITVAIKSISSDVVSTDDIWNDANQMIKSLWNEIRRLLLKMLHDSTDCELQKQWLRDDDLLCSDVIASSKFKEIYE